MERVTKIVAAIFVRMLIIIIVIVMSDDGNARRRRSSRDPYQKFQTGLWFGPVTPVYTTSDEVETNLGGGLFIRSKTFLDSFKLGIDGSYQYFESRGVNTLSLWPVYGSLIYRIPIRIPLIFLLKLGAGGSYVKIRPDRVDQWDPVFMAGVEGSFPAGRVVNIGLRVDYLLIYEGHIEGAKRNGHILNTGITLYFNLF